MNGDSKHNGQHLSESHGEPLKGLYRSLYDLLTSASSERPNDFALACLHQPADLLRSFLPTSSHVANGVSSAKSDYLRWTFSELEHVSHACARALAKQARLRPGKSRIVAYVSNGAEYHVLFRAALELNCVFCPMNPRTAMNAAEVKNVLDVIQPDLLVAQDEITAMTLDESMQDYESDRSLYRVVLESSKEQSQSSWHGLEELLSNAQDSDVSGTFNIERNAEDVVIVLMTSGTTSLPKGCPHTNASAAAWIGATRLGCGHCDSTGGTYRALCSHLPLSHVFGLNTSLGFHLSGLPVVHPSPFFEAGTTLKAIRHERCTDFAGVPAIVSTLLAHPDCAQTDTSCLEFVILGATTSTPAIVKSAMEDLKATKVTDAWGMSEGAPASMTSFADSPSQPPERIHSGYVVPGAHLRVCDPESGELVPRGQPGELRMAGTLVIKDYWTSDNRDTSKEFVEDEYGRWLKTGDQAIMNDDGAIEIVGRYKHLIIRGGENISPKSIESLLMGNFGLEADVVGIPDEVAGEAPAAVLKTQSSADNIPKGKIRQALVKELGQNYALEEMVALDSLQLDDFPKTASGKVQKNVLRDSLLEHLEESGKGASNGTAPDQTDLVEKVTQVWRKVLGVDDLTAKDDLNNYADSLVVARFPGVLQRETGYTLTIPEITANVTPSSQAQLLSKRTNDTQPDAAPLRLPKRDGPPGVDDMIHAHGNEKRFVRTRHICEDLLKTMGLDWNDVQDVTPLYSYQENFLTKRRPQSNNHRHAYLATGSSVEECRTALKSTLSHHDILRTLAIRFDDEGPLHVTVRPSEKWWQHCITALEKPVETAEDLKRLLWNDEHYDYVAFPGPLFRVVIAHVKEHDCAGIVYMGQHSVFDGISLPFFLADLDQLLSGKQPGSLPKRVPFKAWVDSEYSLRDSLAARLSVDWHVRRLRGCHTKRDCLFPTQRAPEWFKGSSAGWIDLNTGKPGPHRSSLDPNSDGATGLSETCDLPDMQLLKRQHGIDAATVLKTALALLNMKRTGQSTAFFAQYQAGRTWPFLQDWQAARLPTAMEVDGPTVQTIILSISRTPGDSCLTLLKRVQEEQPLLARHAHAPFDAIAGRLNDDGSGDGDVMREVARRQIFNWLPPSSGDGDGGFARLRRMQQVSRTDCGMLWNCMQLGPGRVGVMPSWDDAQLTPGEVGEMLGEIVELAGALATAGNWGKECGEM